MASDVRSIVLVNSKPLNHRHFMIISNLRARGVSLRGMRSSCEDFARRPISKWCAARRATMPRGHRPLGRVRVENQAMEWRCQVGRVERSEPAAGPTGPPLECSCRWNRAKAARRFVTPKMSAPLSEEGEVI